jgi:transcriptional regulator with XRE-family HTH domain
MLDPQDLPGQGLFDPEELGRQVAAKRRSQNLTLRQVAEQTGVSVPTLSRVERGDHLPDRQNLLRLANWVGMRLNPTAQQRRNRAVHRHDADTVEAVELHLRADRNLDGDDAAALTELFKIAYDRLRRRTDDENP